MGSLPPQQPGNTAPQQPGIPAPSGQHTPEQVGAENMRLGPRRSQRLQVAQSFGAQPDWDSHRIPGTKPTTILDFGYLSCIAYFFFIYLQYSGFARRLLMSNCI